jgi:hypothetical protein
MNLGTEEIAKKIILLGEMICGVELYAYQYAFALAIVRSVLERSGLDPTALFSRQSGKTEAVAVVSIACCVVLPGLAQAFPDDERVAPFARGFWVGVYAPKDRQAKIAFGRIREYATKDDKSEVSEQRERIYRDKGIQVEVETSRGDSISWSNGSWVLSETASETTDNEGQTWHLLIIDESQKVASFKIKKELAPMLTDTNGCLVRIGTASASKGDFFRKIEVNVAEERNDGRRHHFQTDYQAVIAQRRQKFEEEQSRYEAFIRADPVRQKQMLIEDPHASRRPQVRHLNYERHIEKVLRDLHGDIEEETFKMNYRLLWADNREIAVPEHIWNALAIPNLEMNLTGIQGYLVAGLDVAKGTAENADQTVLSILLVDVDHPMKEEKAVVRHGEEAPVVYMKTLIGLYTFRGDFEEVQYDGVIDVVRQYPTLRYMVMDSTGVGDPVCARLKRLLPDLDIEGVSWANSHIKNAVYKTFLMEVKSSRLRYAAGPDTRCTREFEEMQKQVTELQKKFVGKSDLMLCEAEEGDHDDYPDSIAFATYAEKRSFEEQIPEPSEAEASSFSNQKAPRMASGMPVRADRYRSGRRGRYRH